MEEQEKVTGQEKKNLDDWDDYISGNFLKAINVDSESDAFVVVAVEEAETIDKKGKSIRLHLEKNESEFDFDLNKTNAAKAKELGVDSPKGLIGKKIFFKKVLVRNPQTNQEVDGLRIHKIE